MDLNERQFAPTTGRSILRVRETMDPIESYEDRDGYNPDFLADGAFRVEMPGLGEWARVGAVAHRLDKEGEYIVPYRHFSVIVSAERRMPLVSAVNIDGTQEKSGIKRTNIWKRDPRLPKDVQILEECYGRSGEGFFSRGHMTRREDPNWGTLRIAKQADADTFHATNAAPQAQSFNSPIWLGLEDHLLRNANLEDMHISVFSGPIFAEDDEELHGVLIPSRFWKIVAFVHDDTQELTVTGYIASQAVQIEGLRRPQFVFGEYEDWQVSIRTISAETGLDFSHLEEFDPLGSASDSFALKIKSMQDIYIR
jgi:endonuclease G